MIGLVWISCHSSSSYSDGVFGAVGGALGSGGRKSDGFAAATSYSDDGLITLPPPERPCDQFPVADPACDEARDIIADCTFAQGVSFFFRPNLTVPATAVLSLVLLPLDRREPEAQGGEAGATQVGWLPIALRSLAGVRMLGNGSFSLEITGAELGGWIDPREADALLLPLRYGKYPDPRVGTVALVEGMTILRTWRIFLFAREHCSTP